MDNLHHNILNLMLQLSRIQNSNRILGIFMESMNSLFQDIQFYLLEEGEDAEHETFDLKTNSESFGSIVIEYGQTIVPLSTKTLIKNAVTMLVVLLENRTHQEKLVNEKEKLKRDFKRQTEHLRLRDEQYKALTEFSEDMILRFNSQHEIVYANVCAERIMNITRPNLINKNISDLNFSLEQNSFWQKNLDRLFSLGISFNESMVFSSGNKKSTYDVRFVPEKNELNEVIYVIATARDITELKNKEKALTESQWHLKQAQRIAKIGSWEWNLKYNRITLSDELFKILELDSQENSPNFEDLKAFLNEDLWEICNSIHQNPPETIDPFEIEINIVRADKQIRHCIFCGEPIYSRTGKLKKIHGTLQDITERKLMESEIKSARLKAEESDKLKSAFLANMSHEIRTPLNGILGFSELLKRKNLTSEKRNLYSEIINSNGKQLLKIISDIIDISKIESNLIFIDKTGCSINNIMQEQYMLFLKELKNNEKTNIELVLETPEYNDTTLICDEIRLRQVISNLLSNAIKFTQEGQIRLGYEVKKKEIEFYVKDTGIGIDPEFQKVIFERFRQANDSVSREYGGTGLGLAISKSLVELMHGKIWVISKESEGSEFRFTLPLESPANNISFITDHFANGEYFWPGKKILIVEDDLPSVQLLQETLEDSRAELFHADNGEKAIELHNRTQPDVILMDIRLPKMSGLDAIRAIRDLDKDVAIIAITANAFVEDRVKCLIAGSNDYISKPVDRNQLLSSIDKLLYKKMVPN